MRLEPEGTHNEAWGAGGAVSILAKILLPKRVMKAGETRAEGCPADRDADVSMATGENESQRTVGPFSPMPLNQGSYL